MWWLDLVAMALLLAFVWAGVQRGALASGLALVGLVAAYIVALAGGPALEPLAASLFGTPGLLGVALAGTALAVLTLILFGGISFLARRAERERRGDAPRSAPDRLLGGLFGAVRAGIFLLLLGMLGNWLDAARGLGGEGGDPSASSMLGQMTQDAVEAGAGAIVGDDATSQFAVRTLARPGETLAGMQRVLDDPRFEGLRGDTAFWLLVQDGQVDAALNRGSFLQVAYAPDLRHELARLGVVDAEAADDPRAFRASVIQTLDTLAPRLQALRDDPELKRLANDPEVQALIESGDTFGLLRHPGVRRLVARVGDPQTPAGHPEPPAN